jgi:hypothetical protein
VNIYRASFLASLVPKSRKLYTDKLTPFVLIVDTRLFITGGSIILSLSGTKIFSYVEDDVLVVLQVCEHYINVDLNGKLVL